MTITTQASSIFPFADVCKANTAAPEAETIHASSAPVFEPASLTPFAPPVEIQSDAGFYHAAGAPDPFANIEKVDTDSGFYQSMGAPNPFADADPVPTTLLEPVVPAPTAALEPVIPQAGEPDQVSAAIKPNLPEPALPTSASPLFATEPSTPFSFYKPDVSNASHLERPASAMIPREPEETRFSARSFKVNTSIFDRDRHGEALWHQKSRSLSMSVLALFSPRLMIFRLERPTLMVPVQISFEIYSFTFRSKLSAYPNW